MVVDQSNIDHIMRGLQSTEGVRLHNHRKKLRQRFDIIKKLGQGTYGKVQLGINKETSQEVAIKTIKKCKIETEADLVRIRREIQIMSSVRHPNIIHIYEVFENREKMVLVMEYAAGGELYDYLSERKVLDENEARRIFRQISTAVYYCHKHKICHRDLKLENILLDEHGSAKIADFGLSNVFDEQRLLGTFCGSPLYASPEIVKGTPYHGPEVDCWSLGVLLYTLVYGAMPFDGSNFKRLVKQISQGDYFEPKKASPASPLIREMLTVNPGKRATIEQICSHWWVNQGFNVSCLDIAEDLANQTPVRLDLLLSLAPPPENSDKLVVTDEQNATAQDQPARSMSFGNLMELDPNTEQRIREFIAQEVPSDTSSNEKTIKRKLETGPSESSVTKGGARKKEKIKPSDLSKEKAEKTEKAEKIEKLPETAEQNVVMDVDSSSKVKASDEKSSPTDSSANVEAKKLPEETEKVPIESKENEKPAETEGITKDKPTRKSIKTTKKKVVKDSDSERKEEGESTEAKAKVKKKKKSDSPVGVEEEAGATATAAAAAVSPAKKEVKREKSESKEREEAVGKELKRENSTRKSRGSLKLSLNQEKEKSQTPGTPDEVPSKPMERRKSKIFETAEKFMTTEARSPTQEKPKKVFIPGVKVSDFAKAFERRSSVTTTPVLKSSPSKKVISPEKKPDEKEEKKEETKREGENSSQTNDNQTVDSQVTKGALETEKSVEVVEDEEGGAAAAAVATTAAATATTQSSVAEEATPEEPKPVNDERLKKLKDSARNIIANAIVEEERKKIKKQILKPPVPKTKPEDLTNKKKALTLQIGNETATVQVHTPENAKQFEPEAEVSLENKENVETPKEKKTAKVEITLKSNTLPRRTSKAEIQLSSPQTKSESANFRTEVEHRVGDGAAGFSTQRSEVAFPVSAAQKPVRSMSLEPEARKTASRERIIPVHFEDGGRDVAEARDRIRELERPMSQTEARSKLPYQRTLSQRSSSLSRQSTQDSDTESTISASGDPIRKSPREVIIPIAVEGGGYVTPRATSLEPSESTKRNIRPFPRKINLWSENGSEDESPFSTLPRHPSRDLDEPFRLHRLRSSRPTRQSAEGAESLSGSEEEEEDDDGFEILTAENLFSTLLSRVRSLTQRLNVEDGVRPGFPSSRLMMNHFGPSERLFTNLHQPLTRLSERPDFGRSLSRDLENGFGRWSRGDLSETESNRSFPRGYARPKRSESDTDSFSESSCRKGKSQGEKKSKRSHSHTRTQSVPLNPTESGELITEYVPTFDGNRSMYVPSRRVRSVSRQNSEGEEAAPNNAKLHRTTSLKAKRPSRISEELSEDAVVVEKDFYDILADKYGIRNVKRYDLDVVEKPEEVKLRTPPDSCKLKENRRSLISLTEIDQKEKIKPKHSTSEQSLNELEEKSVKKILPPLPPKPEKYKTPSEKLAAVLNKLESNYEKSEKTDKVEKVEKAAEKVEKPKSEARGISNELLYGNKKPKKQDELKKFDKERLENLSPKALELYEKTLGLYHKTTEAKNVDKFIEKSEKLLKNSAAKKAMIRHKSDMSLNDYRGDAPTKESLLNPNETPDKSVLSKFFNNSKRAEHLEPQKKLKHYGSLQSKLNDSDVEVSYTVKLPEKERQKSPEKKKPIVKKTEEEEAKKKRIRRLSRDLETELNKMEEEEAALQKQPKNKFLSSLEKKFEKLRLGENKKLVDKAIKSLREKSLEPSDVVSENVLIKRAVSLSDCSEPIPPNRIQSTVNSVLGIFKKFETSDGKKKKPEEVKPGLGSPEVKITESDCAINKSPSALMDDSSSFLSPDSESFDSWSNCSDFGAPDDFVPNLKSISPILKMANMDDGPSSESVGDRIRRKSFYSRFNERKKPRKSAILDGKKKYDQEVYEEAKKEKHLYNRTMTQNFEKPRTQQPYLRTLSTSEYGRKSYEEPRPRPFYKVSPSPTNEVHRKTSLDWPKTVTRSISQSPSGSSFSMTSPIMSKSYAGSFDNVRNKPFYRNSEFERPFSPVRTFSPTRTLSPSFAYTRSPSTNAID